MSDNFVTLYRTALERLAPPAPFNVDEAPPAIGSDGELERWVRETKGFAVSDYGLRTVVV
jgi:hypothetical protein